MGDSADNYINSTETDIMIKRQMIRAEFYNTYDVMTGIRIASTLGGFFLMMVLLVLYKSKCKTRSLSDQHLEAVIKAAVDQEEQLAALAKRSSSSSYCSGHGLCRCSPRYSMTENTVAECNNWNRRSKTYLTETQYHPYSALSQTSNKFMRSSVLEYSFEEDEDDDMEDESGTNGYRVAKWLEVPGEKKWIPRGNSAITVSSNDTSYLEARGSSLIIGHPPSPLNHPPPAGDPPWEFYYPIDIQVIQPTPCLSPSGGSRESFSDVPKHTDQLLPAASRRHNARHQHGHQHHQRDGSSPSPAAATAAAPIASIRTSCSSCSDDAASTATTVNSSVFADDCCCTTTTTSPALLAAGSDALQRRRYSSPTPLQPPPPTGGVGVGGGGGGGGGGASGVTAVDVDRTATIAATATTACAAAGTSTAAVRPPSSFHDYNRGGGGDGRSQQYQQQQQPPPAIGGRNVIVVKADVNPIADSIVNANSLSGSLRALYDASKETLF